MRRYHEIVEELKESMGEESKGSFFVATSNAVYEAGIDGYMFEIPACLSEETGVVYLKELVEHTIKKELKKLDNDLDMIYNDIDRVTARQARLHKLLGEINGK